MTSARSILGQIDLDHPAAVREISDAIDDLLGKLQAERARLDFERRQH